MTGIQRDVAVINLDPANDTTPYTCDADIRDLIKLDEVMEDLELGPNGGLVYCIEYLAKNTTWLKEALNKCKGSYIILDLPGQVELFTQHKGCKDIVSTIIDDWNYRMVTVHLVDAHHCTDPSKYISSVLMSLSCMLHLETPHVNLLSKCDLIEKYGRLKFGLEFYTNVMDLKYLVPHIGDEKDPFLKKHRSLSEKIIDVVEGFGLVAFTPLSILEKDSMKNALAIIDKANGYVPMPRERNLVLNMIAREPAWNSDTIQHFQEKYINDERAKNAAKFENDNKT